MNSLGPYVNVRFQIPDDYPNSEVAVTLTIEDGKTEKKSTKELMSNFSKFIRDMAPDHVRRTIEVFKNMEQERCDPEEAIKRIRAKRMPDFLFDSLFDLDEQKLLELGIDSQVKMASSLIIEHLIQGDFWKVDQKLNELTVAPEIVLAMVFDQLTSFRSESFTRILATEIGVRIIILNRLLFAPYCETAIHNFLRLETSVQNLDQMYKKICRWYVAYNKFDKAREFMNKISDESMRASTELEIDAEIIAQQINYVEIEEL